MGLDEIIQGVTPGLFQSLRVRWYKAEREGMSRVWEEDQEEINGMTETKLRK